MNDLKKYQAIGESFIKKLWLLTYPVAVRLIKHDEPIPESAIRPFQAFNSEVPACLTYTWCRHAGMSFYLTKDDIACKPIVLYFGLDELRNPEDLYKTWAKKARYKTDIEAEKASRESDARLNAGEFTGLIVSPLNQTIIVPHLTMIFCSPLILSHLILAATFDGSNIISYFNGMEASCKEGIIRTYKTNQCQVVSPGMGDRVMAGVQDHEMIFSIPESKFEKVLENLFKAGTKIPITPFGIPHLIPTLGPTKLFGQPVEPDVWPALRRKLKKQ
ncbi:MAG: DUF169 domain-containing protein [Candidatus Helarchaeota archaeon]